MEWSSGGVGLPTDPQPLESIGQLRDLIASLSHEQFLVVAHATVPGRFTQCARVDDRFRTECALRPSELYAFTDSDGMLPMSLCQTVMGAYVQSNGQMPHLDGYTPEAVQY